MEPQGVIFDIQHFSLHDGPGVRSTVFFKGCPLSCLWCANPESQRRKPELLYFAANCVSCGACAEACPNDARTLSGRKMRVDEVVDEVRQHWRIFMQSGGGVTCSGGEILSQPVFLQALLQKLHDEMGFHLCLDTSGYAPWSRLEQLLPHADMILLDLKHMDAARHKAATGRDNKYILENARRLGKRGFPVLVRLPLIPGFNDDDDNLFRLGAFMKEIALPAIEILPYHEFGSSKYEALGKTYHVYENKRPRVREAREILSAFGLEVVLVEQENHHTSA
ncbi:MULTISPECIES: glycyl-radical enzyme activating protein [unclassified Brenneria]|uniref:glycyl-radical enzyme activating protein n=1 Tax=unclassified Brenneria TaxID=2634434 RepID=UPI0029C35131|nr:MULTISPECIES: glycyl-radical enzyme activating protein [unclassified Brenneria]MDX5627162.1 glycyl-radical enzyme activating protein [Brenneria sp. L3-3Z]MDX5694683.1 glycyl-radical enzyme activating protein [Brenneria sp. L4-2C]